MEDIVQDFRGVYRAIDICTDVKQCSKNQYTRNRALNQYYFQDVTGFYNWNNVENYKLDASDADDKEHCVYARDFRLISFQL